MPKQMGQCDFRHGYFKNNKKAMLMENVIPVEIILCLKIEKKLCPSRNLRYFAQLLSNISYYSTIDMAIFSGVIGSSLCHTPVAR